MTHIPFRWLPYKPIGQQIEGTRIICFKVPLSEKFFENKNLPNLEEIKLTPQTIVEKLPKVGLVIDLTATKRYYSPQEFTSKGVKHEKIMIQGHVIPKIEVFEKFYDIIEKFLKESPKDLLIGVHCTHGLNRTGLLVGSYMVNKLGMSGKDALNKFHEARGHSIERQAYVDYVNLCDTNVPYTSTNTSKHTVERIKEFANNPYHVARRERRQIKLGGDNANRNHIRFNNDGNSNYVSLNTKNLSTNPNQQNFNSTFNKHKKQSRNNSYNRYDGNAVVNSSSAGTSSEKFNVNKRKYPHQSQDSPATQESFKKYRIPKKQRK